MPVFHCGPHVAFLGPPQKWLRKWKASSRRSSQNPLSSSRRSEELSSESSQGRWATHCNTLPNKHCNESWSFGSSTVHSSMQARQINAGKPLKAQPPFSYSATPRVTNPKTHYLSARTVGRTCMPDQGQRSSQKVDLLRAGPWSCEERPGTPLPKPSPPPDEASVPQEHSAKDLLHLTTRRAGKGFKVLRKWAKKRRSSGHLAPPQVNLPFLSGKYQIGCRFSINTLSQEVQRISESADQGSLRVRHLNGSRPHEPHGFRDACRQKVLERTRQDLGLKRRTERDTKCVSEATSEQFTHQGNLPEASAVEATEQLVQGLQPCRVQGPPPPGACSGVAQDLHTRGRTLDADPTTPQQDICWDKGIEKGLQCPSPPLGSLASASSIYSVSTCDSHGRSPGNADDNEQAKLAVSPVLSVEQKPHPSQVHQQNHTSPPGPCRQSGRRMDTWSRNQASGSPLPTLPSEAPQINAPRPYGKTLAPQPWSLNTGKKFQAAPPKKVDRFVRPKTSPPAYAKFSLCNTCVKAGEKDPAPCACRPNAFSRLAGVQGMSQTPPTGLSRTAPASHAISSTPRPPKPKPRLAPIVVPRHAHTACGPRGTSGFLVPQHMRITMLEMNGYFETPRAAPKPLAQC